MRKSKPGGENSKPWDSKPPPWDSKVVEKPPPKVLLRDYQPAFFLLKTLLLGTYWWHLEGALRFPLTYSPAKFVNSSPLKAMMFGRLLSFWGPGKIFRGLRPRKLTNSSRKKRLFQRDYFRCISY